MKRTALILLTAIYLLSCLGVVANSFYCCGVLQSTSILHSANQKTYCKMASRVPGCCKTKKQYLKVHDQHFAATAFSLNVKLLHTIIGANYQRHLSLQAFNIAHIAINSHGPPYSYKTPAYLRNCTYRI